MGKMKYLFIDIEWNQVENVMDTQTNEILELAGIVLSEEFEEIKRFYKIVRPYNIELVKASTYKFLNLQKQHVMCAKTLEVILDNFFKTFHTYDVIIMWSRESYELFKHSVKSRGMKMNKHKIVILQELLCDITQNHTQYISFEKALKLARIEYNPAWIHCAKHDVNYLQILYKSVYKSYSKSCKDFGDTECYTSSKTNILHDIKCRYISNITNKNFKVANKKDALTGGRICKSCGKKGYFNKIDWKEVETKKPIKVLPSFEDEYIYEVCGRFGVKCQIGMDVIFIDTGIGKWRVYHDGKNVTSVFHENYRVKKDQACKKKKANEGYHRQNVKKNTFFEVVRYIESHDRYFFNVKQEKKNRIDMLFEKIERERILKERMQAKEA